MTKWKFLKQNFLPSFLAASEHTYFPLGLTFNTSHSPQYSHIFFKCPVNEWKVTNCPNYECRKYKSKNVQDRGCTLNRIQQNALFL